MEVTTPALSQLSLAIAAHPLRADIEHRVAPAGRSLAETLAAEGVLPGAWAVSVGGVDIPAEYWGRMRVKPGHLIECRAVVRKQVLQIAAIAALSYFTLGVGGLAAGSFMGLSGAAGAFAAGTAFVAGSIVINKLLPPAAAKMGGGTAERAESYGLSGGRNTARQYQPLGLMLGECKVVPDLAAQQFTWFEGDDQYLSCLLHAGINCGSVDTLRLGDTLLSDYSGVQVTRAGFPARNDGEMPSTSVDSVAGGLLDRPTEAEPDWTVRTTSRDTVRIAVDIEATVTDVNNQGNWQPFGVMFDAEYRLVGGNWLPFAGGRITLINASGKPVRRTFTEDVAPGQYEVRMRKVDVNATSTQKQNAVTWSALKSYQADTADYAGQPRVRVEVKASGQLSGSLDTVSWIGRAASLSVWTGTEWIETTEPGAAGTSNPGAQLLMLMRGIRRPSDGRLIAGLGLPDNKIDLESLKAFMVRCTARGFRFDDFVQEAMTIENLLEAIADVGFGRLSRSTGKYGVVWLAEDQPISGVINMASMKARSFSVDYDLLPTAEEAQYDFYDAANGYTQQSVRVVSPLAVTTPNRQASVSVRGINFAAHAAQRARLMLGQSAYARKSISWEMDLEYMVYRTGSLVALSHDLTQWGAGGRVVSFSRSAGNWTIGLDVDLPAVDGAVQMMALALPREKTMRVFPVASITADRRSITVAQAWPADLPAPGEGADVLDTTWLFDIKATPGYRCRITSVQPNSGMTGARITAVPEAPELWDYVWNGAWSQPAGDSLLARVPPVAMNAVVSAERVRLGETWRTELTITFDAAGNYDHAQVWGSSGGGPMELLDASVYGTRASWFADRGQQWTVEVRPFDSLGRMGTVATVAYSVAGDLPAAVGGLALAMTEQGAVAAWVRPDGLRGVDWSLTEIRVGAGWTAGAVVFSGRADSYNLGWLAAGTTTVWASHRNTAGDWSDPVSTALTVEAPAQPLIDTGRDQSAVRLEWQDCRTTQPLRGYRVLKGTTVSSGSLLGIVSVTSYTRIESVAGLQRYWILAEDVAGNLSAAGQAQVETLPSVESVMAELENGLGNVLDPETGLPALNQALINLQNEVATSVADLDQSLEGLQDAVDQSVGDLEQAVWGDVRTPPPFPLVRIAAQQDANNQRVAHELAATADDLLASVLAWGQVKQTMADAGIFIDAATGQVHIYGVDSNSERLSQVNVDLDAVRSTLTLKASTTYVDQRIAAAQLDPTGQNVFDGLEARIAEAEIEIDGLTAAVTTKASLLEVSSQGGRLTTAEQTISAQGQAINQKVNTTDFVNAVNGIDSRLGTAETTLSAIGGVSTVSSLVTQSRGLQKQSDLQAETTLRDILNGWAEGKVRDAQYASGRQEMTAKVDEGLAAQAQRVVELQALVNTADAALGARISTEETARVNADGAISTRVDNLGATVQGNASTASAGLLAEQTARAQADAAEATARQALSATVDGVYASLNAAIIGEQSARAGADASEVSARQALSTKLLGTVDPTGASLPSLSAGLLFDERSARSSADVAEALARQALEAMVQGNAGAFNAAIVAEQSARAGGDAAEAAAREALAATVQGNYGTLTAGINAEQSARASGDASEAGARQALSSKVLGAADPTGVTLQTLSAGILYDERQARTTADSAQVQQISALTATVGGNQASVNGALSAITTEQQAQASQLGGVTATVAGHTASIASQSSAIAGLDGRLSATWSLSVTAGGKVAGMVLNNTGAASSLVMLVDKFAIALNDGDSAKYPFIVGTVNGVPTVAMSSAFIGDASIGTLKLAGESVTVPRFVAFTNSTYHSSAESQVFTYALTLPAAASVLVSCKAYATTQNAALDWRGYYRVYVNGVERFVRYHGYKQPGNPTLPMHVDLQFAVNLPAGTHQLRGTWQVNAAPGIGPQELALEGTELFVLGTMR